MTWWNPFRRAPKAPPPSPPSPVDRREMNEDWTVGDLAECIADNWSKQDFPGNPRVGDVLRVSGVTEGIALGSNHLIIALGFESKQANLYWDCTSFRKLRPALDPAEDEFTVWLKDRIRTGEPVA